MQAGADELAPGGAGGTDKKTCFSCHIPPKICTPSLTFARWAGVRQLNA